MDEDIFGQAIHDYHVGQYTEDIKTYSSLDEEDVIPVPYLFRDFDAMPPLEKKALSLCKGKILDIGCGAGSHSLYLQNKGYMVTGLDRSERAVETCRLRGLSHTVISDIFTFNNGPFDTLLMLMNGIGIVGELRYLGEFLTHLKTLLRPGGQVLLDSSDIIYMFESDEDDGGYWIPDTPAYYGEVTFTMHYKKNRTPPFQWLYVDYNTLQRAALHADFHCELVGEGSHYDYLARLSLPL
tara:strand:- start:170375 stop:171091 length:717 start_codon:yes stop_codon:yes gene_type:complete